MKIYSLLSSLIARIAAVLDLAVYTIAIIVIIGFYSGGVPKLSVYSLEPSDLLKSSHITVDILVGFSVTFIAVLLVLSILDVKKAVIDQLPWSMRLGIGLIAMPFTTISLITLHSRISSMESAFKDSITFGPFMVIKRNWSLDERLTYVDNYIKASKSRISETHKIMGIEDTDYVYKLASCGETIGDIRLACDRYMWELKKAYETWHQAYQAAHSPKSSLFTQLSSKTSSWYGELTQVGNNAVQYCVEHPYIVLTAGVSVIGLVAAFIYAANTLDSINGKVDALSTIAQNQVRHLASVESQLKDTVTSVATLQEAPALSPSAISALENLAVLLEIHPELVQHIASLVQPRHMAVLAAARRVETPTDGFI